MPSRAERAFARDGYAVLGGFVSGPELARLRCDVDAHLAGPLPPGCERPGNTLAPLRWSDATVGRVLAAPGRVARLATAVAGGDLRWISGYVSSKPPGSGPLWWHQDWWCWDHPVSFRPAAPQVALLCYLTATDERTAALRVLPGSHRRATALHAALPEAHAGGAQPPAGHPAVSDHPDQVTLALAPGDAVVLDYRLLHGTHPNAGGRRRDCVLLTFAPSWRDLPEDVRAHLIRHPAQPRAGERVGAPAWTRALLPAFDGRPRDLELNRTAPTGFVTRRTAAR